MTVQLGAPGIYRSARAAVPVLRPVRLDVAGFAGVAPRGPVGVPVEVPSWTEYRRRFGDAEGHGRLPYAVRAFFDHGGATAYVVRVGPLDDGGVAGYRLPFPAGDVLIDAADEGEWGNRLEIRWRFDVSGRFVPSAGVPVAADQLPLPPGVPLPDGTLLRLRGRGLPPAGEFRWVLATRPDRQAVLLDRERPPDLTEVAVVTGTIAVTDHDAGFARAEEFAGLGLRPEHPRAAARILLDESRLVHPAGDWGPVLPADGLLGEVAGVLDRPGTDRSALITGASFFDTDPDPLGPADPPPPDDLIDAEDPSDLGRHRGVDALTRVAGIGLILVPDLQWSRRAAEPAAEPPPPPPPARDPCAPPPLPEPAGYAPAPEPDPLLDPLVPDELTLIVNRQRMLAARAADRRRFVALLDVPQGLNPRAIARWRATFDTSYAAAYHPWLGAVRRDDRRGRVVLVPPSAFAAGIIASRELRLGLPWGAANELATGAVTAAAPITDADHDLLHGLGINVFRAERDGFRLTAARTLSGDQAYRQLSVRRLMTMLRLTVELRCQWLVFEPATPALRTLLRDALTQLLRDLYRQGAFTGGTEEDAFFVHCDEGLNPPASVALGRLVAEVGVAPAEPLEFLVLRVARDGEGGVRVEGGDG